MTARGAGASPGSAAGPDPEPYAGIVVAGGQARRLGGVDKPMLDVGGRTLLARSLDALSGADPVVVVGPRRPDVHGVRWTREEPPGGGPVAALAAGLALVDRPRVVVLAGDLRGVTPDVVGRLLDALDRQAREHPAAGPDPDGAVLVDAAGRRQWLLGAWRTAALRAAIPAAPAGHALRRVLNGLTIADVPARGDEAADVDTAGDLP